MAFFYFHCAQSFACAITSKCPLLSWLYNFLFRTHTLHMLSASNILNRFWRVAVPISWGSARSRRCNRPWTLLRSRHLKFLRRLAAVVEAASHSPWAPLHCWKWCPPWEAAPLSTLTSSMPRCCTSRARSCIPQWGCKTAEAAI